MGKDSEFDILFSKYNLAVAKAQDLQEQLTTKQEQWQKRNEDFDTIEKNVRELCEAILAKDSKEMVLGIDYSWAVTPVSELILKAKKVFKEYNAKRTDLMRKIMDTAEDRRAQVDSLKEEILMLKTQGVRGNSTLTEQELRDQIEKDLKEKNDRVEQIKNSKFMSPEAQKAVASGRINIQEVKDALSNGEAVIVEEDFDIDDEEPQKGEFIHSKEQKLKKEAIEDNHRAKITKKSIPISKSKKSVKNRQELQKKLDKEYTMNILSELEKKISEHGWLVLDTIGTYGISKAADILNKALEVADDQKFDTSKSRLRSNLTDLCNIGVIKRESIKSPYSQFYVYCLTVDGARIFKEKHGEDAVLSEMDKIIAEHDNLNHGYGIKEVSERIIENNCYEKVEIWNRKNHVITVSGKVTYIPDLYCTGKNGEHTYIEYELGHYSQRSFNIKCNKMLACTTMINYIVPDRSEAEKIIKMLVEWTKTKGTGGNMRHVIVRVTTAGSIKGLDLTKNENWMYTFQPIRDKEPKNNF